MSAVQTLHYLIAFAQSFYTAVKSFLSTLPLFSFFISFEMTYVGNYICIVFVVLETILLNGVFVGWGILTAVFKEDELFFLDENWHGLNRFFYLLSGPKS